MKESFEDPYNKPQYRRVKYTPKEQTNQESINLVIRGSIEREHQTKSRTQSLQKHQSSPIVSAKSIFDNNYNPTPVPEEVTVFPAEQIRYQELNDGNQNVKVEFNALERRQQTSPHKKRANQVFDEQVSNQDYQRTVAFEEKRQQQQQQKQSNQVHPLHTSKLSQIQSINQGDEFQQYYQINEELLESNPSFNDQEVSQKILAEQINDIIESLTMINKDSLQETNDCRILIHQVIQDDIKPITSKNERRDYFIAQEISSPKNEMEELVKQSEDLLKTIQQKQGEMEEKKYFNNNLQDDLLETLIYDSKSPVKNQQEIVRVDRQLKTLIEQASERQVRLERNNQTQEYYDVLKNELKEHDKEEEILLLQSENLDKEILFLTERLYHEKLTAQDLEIANLFNSKNQLELQDKVTLLKDEIDIYHQYYDTQISLLQNHKSQTQKDYLLLQQKVEDYRKEIRTLNQAVDVKMKENDEFKDERIKISADEESLFFIEDVEKLIREKVDQLYPVIEGQDLVKDNLHYQDLLEQIVEIEKQIDDTNNQLTGLEEENIELSNQVESQSQDQNLQYLLSDYDELIKSEIEFSGKVQYKIGDDVDELTLISQKQDQHNNDIKDRLQIQEQEIDQLLRQYEMIHSELKGQQKELEKDTSFSALKQKLDQEVKRKQNKVAEVRQKVSKKKLEAQEMIWYQKKKDDLIEELKETSGINFSERQENGQSSTMIDNINVDEYVKDFLLESKVPMKKVCQDFYEYGTKKIYLKVNKDKEQVMVKDKGGQYLSFKDFIRKYEQEEIDKIQRLNLRLQNNQLDLDQSMS